MPEKIIRTVCLFRRNLDGDEITQLKAITSKLETAGYQIQTKRICSPTEFGRMEKQVEDPAIMLSVGTVYFDKAMKGLDVFYTSRDNFNVEVSSLDLELKHIDLLFNIIQDAPAKTFNFTYVFNNAPSSPFMPTATYERDGFAIGLQTTDLAEGCNSLSDWFERMKQVFTEIDQLMDGEKDFLGIDSSIAPLFQGSSSLVNFVKRIEPRGFSHSLTTDIYTQMSRFIKKSNPKPVGLSGLMLPCLEDFELAHEYEQGNFSIERNIYASLHSGLGVDVYPLGIDEKPERVLEILKLIQALSNKYDKPLSARFVSDGQAKIGDRTNFGNKYLYDVVVREL